ncbi:MAG: glycosyltransferase family 4 protein [Candidatus Omnitrophota bacterium]
MKRILVIPHSADKQVRIRLLEIGRVLSRRHKVFCLDWQEPLNYSFSSRLKAASFNAFTPLKILDYKGISLVNIPFLHRPLSLACRFNQYQILRFVNSYKIDVLLHGLNYFFPAPEKALYKDRSCINIFDFNDLPVEEMKTRKDKFVYSFAAKESHKADYITVCSYSLRDYVKANFSKDAIYAPNGADFNTFRSVSRSEVREIRKKHSSEGKFVIGYIGNLGEWVDIELLIKSYLIFKKKFKPASLWIVGGGYCLDKIKRRFSQEDIVFTRAVPSEEIASYFCALNIGVNPSKKSIFQDKAFHIKLVEYAAARKIAISTPLEELGHSKFPHVLLREPLPEVWAEAFMHAKELVWDEEWNNLSRIYDWERIAEGFFGLIEG